MNKIVFFNHYHRGDLHTSKEFVKEVMNKLPDIEFEYWHSNPDSILQEIGISPSLQKTPSLLDKQKSRPSVETSSASFGVVSSPGIIPFCHMPIAANNPSPPAGPIL